MQKVDPIVGAWNASGEGFNTVTVYNEGGTSAGQSDVDIGAAFPTLPAPPGFRITISTGNWKKVSCNKYVSVDSNVLTQQAATYGDASASLLRLKKTTNITLVPGAGGRDEDELHISVVFTRHLLSDVQCINPLSPPGLPAVGIAKRLLY